MGLPLVSVLSYDDSDDDVARRHADCSNCENGFTPDFVDVKYRWDCGEEHDDPNNASREKGDSIAG